MFFWADTAEASCSQFLINLGFALFAIDAIITSWVSSCLRKEQDVLHAGQGLDETRDKMIKALEKTLGSSAKVDEYTLLTLRPEQELLKNFTEYTRSQNSERLVHTAYLLAGFDVVYFIAASGAAIFPYRWYCAIIWGVFIFLFIRHVLFRVEIGRIHKKADTLQEEAEGAIKRILHVCNLRGATLDDSDSAASALKNVARAL